MDNFDFDSHFKRTENMATRIMLVTLAVWVAVVGGIGFVAFKILRHFGIL